MAKKEAVELPGQGIQIIELTLVGDSPLICHRFSPESLGAMLDKQLKKAKTAKAAKDPEADYLGSLYPHPDGGHGHPTIAFKKAAVDACSFVENVTKVKARGDFHIRGDFALIQGEPRPREDVVRIAMNTADIRYRGEFPEWRTTLSIRYNADGLSAEQIVHLFNVAGFSVGVGDWRPQKNGSFGMFHVATEAEAA